MAGDWIKIEENMPDKPEVHGIARDLAIEVDAVAGKLIRVWAWASRNCPVSGRTDVRSLSAIDRVAFHVGFADAMSRAGWLMIEGEIVTFPNFDYHCSQPSKERALDQKRKKQKRIEIPDSVRKLSAPRPDSNRTKAGPEKRREEKSINTGEAPESLTLSSEALPGPKKTRTRNPLLDVLATIDGSNVEQVTPSAWAGIGKALADIKAVSPDVTPDEIARRAAVYRAKHRDWPLTPGALAKHWANSDRTSNFAPTPAKTNASEPKAWKAWLDTNRPESVYSRGNEHAEKTWAQLDLQTQQWITSEMRKDEVGDVNY